MELNVLPVLTWNWVQVNDTKFEIPKFVSEQVDSQTTYTIPKQILSDWNKCKLGGAGVSKEALLWNETQRTHQTVIHAEAGEIKEAQTVKFSEDNQSSVTMDATYIIAEESSKVSVIFDYAEQMQQNSIETFRNSVIYVTAKEGAEVTIYYISRNSKNHTALCSVISQVYQDAAVNLVQVETGAKRSFFNYTSNLWERGANTQIRTIYFADENRELNLAYEINHIGEQSESDILVNGALKDTAKKTFKGTIDFKKGASRSKGKEEEYAILLSEKVKNVAIPILLCQEDDVEGVHAASAGKMDEEILFYIMSRGFCLDEAKKIVLDSRFTPILDMIEDDYLKNEIWKEIGDRI